MEELKNMLDYFINERLDRVILSNPRVKGEVVKAVIRPVALKGNVMYQAEEFTEKQAFHRNLSAGEAKEYIAGQLSSRFKQGEISSALGTGRVLVGKKGNMTVKMKKQAPSKISAAPVSLPAAHNRQKRYILKEGTPVPFLVELGVMTKEGSVVRSRYDKFRQINRFLEFIEDVLPRLNKNRENTIIDFGCGKSYLTFAMYYYLKEVKGYSIRVIGLDLKQDVINLCNRLARQFGFERLTFYHGDIASFEGVEQVDMVVTLHACDLATDYALAKAVHWNAAVILSVPCCQHQLNGQMKNDLMAPIFRYGILKERMAALCTDGLRAEILENQGYRTQLLEFIDMEHTPKNLLIRAVKRQEGSKKLPEELKVCMEAYHVKPTLADLLTEKEEP